MTPTARSLRLLKSQGYDAAVVEKWIPQARRRVDLFGIGDILAMKVGAPVLLVQTTTGSNLSARRTKALAEPLLQTWLGCGQRFELHGWSKRGPRNAAKRWGCKMEEITTSQLRSIVGFNVLHKPPGNPAGD